MRQSQNIGLRQGQSLVMTQQLQQSIKLLQYNAIELQQFLAAECEQNPFLLHEEADQQADNDRHEVVASEEMQGADSADAPPMEDSLLDTASEMDSEAQPATDELPLSAPIGDQQAESWDYEPSERTPITHRNKDGDAFEDDALGEVKPTLKEHLSAQFLVDESDPLKRRLGLHLIDLVDEAGYIKEDMEELAAQFGTDAAVLEAVLGDLQKCEPAGICARNLQECLALQLKEIDRFDPAMATFIENLDLLAASKLDQLIKRCGVGQEDMQDMIREIRSLNPKPGLQFQHDIAEHALPDVIVRRDGNKWKVELNNATLPRVLVNRDYHSEIVMHADGADKKYIAEQMNHANWLVKAMDQRAQTIVKVATDIVIQQENFFKLGIHHLKPLTLKDIAASTGYHESTISRVTTGKFMITPRGFFELKYFFTSGLQHAKGGDDVSSATVKHLIKQLIDTENPASPRSDDEIAYQLNKQNINVARRTVAKYREALHIPSSSHRKRLMLSRVG